MLGAQTRSLCPRYHTASLRISFKGLMIPTHRSCLLRSTAALLDSVSMLMSPKTATLSVRFLHTPITIPHPHSVRFCLSVGYVTSRLKKYIFRIKKSSGTFAFGPGSDGRITQGADTRIHHFHFEISTIQMESFTSKFRHFKWKAFSMFNLVSPGVSFSSGTSAGRFSRYYACFFISPFVRFSLH